MTNYEDHWMIAEQSEPRTKRVAARSTAQIIEAYQNGESMTDAEVEQAYHALVRLKNAVLEIGNDVSLVIPWVVPKLQSFEGFMKHRAERRQEAIRRETLKLQALQAEIDAEKRDDEKKRIAAINAKLNPEMFGDPDADKIRDPNAGWGPWLNRRDGAFPFEPDDYVEVSHFNFHYDDVSTEKGRVSDFWWGWTQQDSQENTVIRRARKWVGPGDPPK